MLTEGGWEVKWMIQLLQQVQHNLIAANHLQEAFNLDPVNEDRRCRDVSCLNDEQGCTHASSLHSVGEVTRSFLA